MQYFIITLCINQGLLLEHLYTGAPPVTFMDCIRCHHTELYSLFQATEVRPFTLRSDARHEAAAAQLAARQADMEAAAQLATAFQVIMSLDFSPPDGRQHWIFLLLITVSSTLPDFSCLPFARLLLKENNAGFLRQLFILNITSLHVM